MLVLRRTMRNRGDSYQNIENAIARAKRRGEERSAPTIIENILNILLDIQRTSRTNS